MREKLKIFFKKAKFLPSHDGDLKKNHKKDCLMFLAVFIAMTGFALIFRTVVQNPDLNITMFYILGNFLVARYTSGYIFGFFLCYFQRIDDKLSVYISVSCIQPYLRRLSYNLFLHACHLHSDICIND